MAQQSEVGPKSARGTVSRVVPGRLVYVDVPDAGGTFSVTPDKFALTQSDGREAHYRGEPFVELGIEVGTEVNVIREAERVQKVVVGRRKPSRRRMWHFFQKHPA